MNLAQALTTRLQAAGLSPADVVSVSKYDEHAREWLRIGVSDFAAAAAQVELSKLDLDVMERIRITVSPDGNARTFQWRTSSGKFEEVGLRRVYTITPDELKGLA